MSALDPVIEALDQTGWSTVVVDPEWRIVWSSPQIAMILGQDAATDLGAGRHLLETRALAAFTVLTEESIEEFVRVHAPYALHDGSLGHAELGQLVDHRFRSIVDAAEPVEPPLRWTLRLAAKREDDAGFRSHGERLVDPSGRLLGYVFMYGSALPASVLFFVGQGDERMYTRLAELLEPGRRPAAVMFADLAGSTELSKRMASAAYFDLIRRLTGAADSAILDAGGIVGKHAGDGMSAFFLAEQVGSSPAAALGALRAARSRVGGAREEGVRMNGGVPGGATVSLGQVATSGRLEVTALGDEVNECARIQEAAHGGVLLATKALIERMEPSDARAAGIDVEDLRYTLVSDLPDAGEKAVRDAGGIAVTNVSIG